MTTPSSTTSSFFDPRLAVVVVIYVLFTAFVSSVHEPWADEAHAWLIARDASLYDLLFVLPHGEGNPSLWHLSLILPARYMSYEYLGYISLLLGLLGVLVFVYFSPFPLPVKLAFPFTYFIFFQYAIITRSYSLFPVLVLSVAALYKRRFENVFIYTFVLALLATTHLFGLFVTFSLSGLHALGLLKRWSELSIQARRNNLICLAVLFLVFCFISFQILPIQHRTLERNILDVSHTVWIIESAVNESFTDIYVVSLVVFTVSLFWFWQHRMLFTYFVLVGPLFAFFSIKYYNPWHTGLLFLIWMFVLWITFDSKAKVRAPALILYSRKAMLACIYVLFGFHVYWAATASYADYQGKYSCSRDVAQVLKQSGAREGKVWARHYHTTAVSPYFEKKLFYNINPGTDQGYWTWFQPDVTEDLRVVVKDRPDAIVLGRKYRELEIEGYVRQAFQAYVFWKDRTRESNHCTVYIREDLR